MKHQRKEADELVEAQQSEKPVADVASEDDTLTMPTISLEELERLLNDAKK